MDLNRVHTVLVRPLQPGNVGSAARAMANHGLRHLTLVNPPAFDPDRARWMAPGAHAWLNEARFTNTVQEAVANATTVIGTSGRSRRWPWPVWSLPQLVKHIEESTGEVHILFGTEDSGLSNDEMGPCHAMLRLETAAHASLNLSQAVAVVSRALFDAARQAGTTDQAPSRQGRRGGPQAGTAAPPPPEAPPSAPATVAFQEAVITRAMETLDTSGYFLGRTPDLVHGTLYRLLHRAQPTKDEAAILMGMLKAVGWKLKAGSEEEPP